MTLSTDRLILIEQQGLVTKGSETVMIHYTTQDIPGFANYVLESTPGFTIEFTGDNYLVIASEQTDLAQVLFLQTTADGDVLLVTEQGFKGENCIHDAVRHAMDSDINYQRELSAATD